MLKNTSYGHRIERGTGNVYAAPTHTFRNGRAPKSAETFIGRVSKVDGGWKHDQSSTIYKTQNEASSMLTRIICG